MTAPRLMVDSLSAWYGPAQAVFDVSFAVRPGEVLALLGPNGAGKSSTLKALMGLVRMHGVVAIDGVDVGLLPTHARSRAGIGYVPEERRIFTGLTVRENLWVGQAPRRDGPWHLDALLALFPNLAGMLDRAAGQMSGGEQQMLAIARSLIGNPQVLLLDEPSEGLAPRIVDAMVDALTTLKRQGLTMILSEQNAHFAQAIADWSLHLEAGHCVPTTSEQDATRETPLQR